MITRLISNKNKNFIEIFKETLASKELIFFLVRRDFLAMYKQTILGPTWYLLQPLITSFIFLIIFNKFAGISTDGVPPLLFYLVANTGWIFFSNTLNSVSLTLINNAELYKKVYFCRLAPVIANIFMGYIKFFFQCCLVFLVYLYYFFQDFNFNLSFDIIFFFISLVHLSIFVFAIGLLICSFAVKYRDLVFILNFATQMLMFATPVIYSFNSIPEKYKFFAYINPLVPIFENMRNSLFGLPLIETNFLLSSVILTVVLFIISIKTFTKFEKNFVDFV